MTDPDVESGMLSPMDPDRHLVYVGGRWVPIPPEIEDE